MMSNPRSPRGAWILPVLLVLLATLLLAGLAALVVDGLALASSGDARWSFPIVAAGLLVTGVVLGLAIGGLVGREIERMRQG